jgi:hypothetical protein
MAGEAPVVVPNPKKKDFFKQKIQRQPVNMLQLNQKIFEYMFSCICCCGG